MHAPRTRTLLPSTTIVATWLLSIALAGLAGVGTASAAPPDTPPDAWVLSPKKLPPGFSGMECTFAFAPNIVPTFFPNAACEEKEWLDSGIFREQARDFYANPYKDCPNGPADLDIIRLCSVDWKNQMTPWGGAGPNGCVPIRVAYTCL